MNGKSPLVKDKTKQNLYWLDRTVNCDDLLIDDNREITEAVSFYLETIDISCKVVNAGKAALDAIINEEFDLALVDA